MPGNVLPCHTGSLTKGTMIMEEFTTQLPVPFINNSKPQTRYRPINETPPAFTNIAVAGLKIGVYILVFT